MDYAAFDAARAGFTDLVVVTRRSLREQVEAGVARHAAGQLRVTIVEQELDRIPGWASVPVGREAPWGTAHAVLVAREVIQDPFAVVNADDFYGAETYRVLAGHLADAKAGRAHWSNVAFPLGLTLSPHGAVNRAVCQTNAAGQLAKVVETRGITRTADGNGQVGADGRVLDAGTLVSMNAWAFAPDLFAMLDDAFTTFLRTTPGLKDECLLPDVVNAALASGTATCRLLESRAPWCGVTHREDRPATVESLARLHAAGAYPPALW